MRNNEGLCEYIVSMGIYRKADDDIYFKGDKFRYFKTFDDALTYFLEQQQAFELGKFVPCEQVNEYKGLRLTRLTFEGFKAIDSITLLTYLETKRKEAKE